MEGSGEIALSDMVDNWLMMINNAGNTIYNKDIKPIKIFGLPYKQWTRKIIMETKTQYLAKKSFQVTFRIAESFNVQSEKMLTNQHCPR